MTGSAADAHEISIPAGDPGSGMPFRLVIKARGARVEAARSEIGFAHRGLEKLAESMTWHSARAVAERAGCASPGIAGTCCCMAVESLFGVEVPARAKWLRTILCEAWRIREGLSHAGRTLAHAGLPSRAALLLSCRDSVEGWVRASFGASGSSSRIGGVARDLGGAESKRGRALMRRVRDEAGGAASALAGDRIFSDRTRGVGVISADAASAWGVTGPSLRAAGQARDLRRDLPYLMYAGLDFEVPVGAEGDVFDRTVVRLLESTESARIVEEAMAMMEPGPLTAKEGAVVLPPAHEVYGGGEGLARHRRIMAGKQRLPAGEGCALVEAASGEMGFHLVSDGSPRPYRFRVRSPSFALCQAAPVILKGCAVEDVPMIVASLGASASEADR
ncbi:MAG: NADH-quinone oxidoreductase subunit D [Proteobacteria bacterium]|nr:NADH-quinone oxidoreductase subunit D [Pseudomonadota bacterium]